MLGRTGDKGATDRDSGPFEDKGYGIRLQEPGGGVPAGANAQKVAAGCSQEHMLELRIRIYHILGARTLEHAATCDLPDSGLRGERRNLSLPVPPDQNLPLKQSLSDPHASSSKRGI